MITLCLPTRIAGCMQQDVVQLSEQNSMLWECINAGPLCLCTSGKRGASEMGDGHAVQVCIMGRGLVLCRMCVRDQYAVLAHGNALTVYM